MSLNLNSFLSGTCSIFNLSGNFYDMDIPVESPSEVDRKAIESDWLAVGNDLKQAIGDFENEYIKKK